MLEQSKIILEKFQIRKTSKQKEKFRNWLFQEIKKIGYEPKIDNHKSILESNNIIIGNPETAKVIYSAHYDTCSVLPFPNFLTPRNMYIYLMFNLLICIAIFFCICIIAFGLRSLGCPKEVILFIPSILCFIICFWMMGGGKANKHTANDNTSGVITLLEIMFNLPKEYRNDVCFIFFDNEEKGMFGSAGFTGKNKEIKEKCLNINFDCVSDGDYLQFYPSKSVKKDIDLMSKLESSFANFDNKVFEVVKTFGFYPSDNINFKKGVGVCSLKKNKFVGYYMDRIHTPKDTILDEKNIELFKNGAIQFVKLLK